MHTEQSSFVTCLQNSFFSKGQRLGARRGGCLSTGAASMEPRPQAGCTLPQPAWPGATLTPAFLPLSPTPLTDQ